MITHTFRDNNKKDITIEANTIKELAKKFSKHDAYLDCQLVINPLGVKVAFMYKDGTFTLLK